MSPRAIARLHICCDGLLVAVAWIAAYWTRRELDALFARHINPFHDYLHSMPMVVIPWLFSGWFFGLYRPPQHQRPIESIHSLLKATLLGFLVLSSIGFFFKEYDFGRAVVLFACGYAVVLQGAGRFGFDAIRSRQARRGGHDIHTLVIGASTTGIRVLQKLQDHGAGYKVVGFLDDNPELAASQFSDVRVVGKLDDLRALAQQLHVEEVIVAIPQLSPPKLLSLVIGVEDLCLTFHVVTDLFEVLTTRTPVGRIGDLPLVPLRGYRHASIFYEPIKRGVDFLGALLALLITLPLWPWWALRIKLDSKGPVLFKQRRWGKNGAPFGLYKFRTMTADADPYEAAPTSRDDKRITHYGAWLRRTSIDELPNLINVLFGQMSLVGPRPEMPFICDTYDEWQRRRLLVKPGITGLWQILGRKDLPMHENLQYDFFYIYNRSLLLDLSILVRTAAVVLGRRGAY
jgi:exopolysaccharide biosynthesis polyprenyl glycosylphosphotransferase